MSADYLPVHDPAVHGPAYAVRVPGRHTQPFAAVRPYLPRPSEMPAPCRCDEHKYGHTPGTDAVLYSGPDAMHLFERAAVRDGRYEDAIAFANHRMALLHAKCEAADMQTRLTLEPSWRALNQLAAARQAAA